MWKRVFHTCYRPIPSFCIKSHPYNNGTYALNSLINSPSFFVRGPVLQGFSISDHHGFHTKRFPKKGDKDSKKIKQTKTRHTSQDASTKKGDKDSKKIKQTKTRHTSQDASTKKGDKDSKKLKQTKTRHTSQDASTKKGDKDSKKIKQTKTRHTSQDASTKPTKVRPKGRKAVLKFVKQLRYTKKKEWERMTAEERILHRINKARTKEARILQGMKKLLPKEWSEVIHDPEVLTPEEQYYFMQMAFKRKNYVPVGRRGIFQGVILNMHLHFKMHQTVLVIIKSFTPEEVKEMAVELARLTGGIVIGFHEEDTIIMYRGKNYTQPPMEIMSPRVTLPRLKALRHSKLRDVLRGVRTTMSRLEHELEILHAKAQIREDFPSEQPQDTSNLNTPDRSPAAIPNPKMTPSDKFKELMAQYEKTVNQDVSETRNSGMDSKSEDLSDMFEIDSDDGENDERPLYLHEFDKFPANSNKRDMNLMPIDSERAESLSESADLTDFDDVDQVILQAAENLKRKRQ